jgi:hypothetical protein
VYAGDMDFLRPHFRSRIEGAYRNNATLFLYYVMRVLVVLAAVLFLIRGDWESSVGTFLVAVLMILPSFIRRRYRIYLPFAIDFGLVSFIFISLFLGGIDDFYGFIPLWDKIVHFQSGLLFSGTGFVVIYLLNESERTPIELSPGFVAVFAIAFSLAIGAIWEIAEFTGDEIFGSHWQAGNSDTMWDLIADLSGAIVFSVGGYFWMYRHKRLPFTPVFLKFMEEARKVAKKVSHKSKIAD